MKTLAKEDAVLLGPSYPGPLANTRWRNAALSAAAVVAAAAGVTFALRAATDPLTDLKAGADALDAGRYPAAIAALKGLPQRLPKLADYSAWFLASAQSATKDYAAVPATLDTVFKQSPASPWFLARRCSPRAR